MRPTASLDARQWTAAARLLKVESSRNIVDFTNGQILKVAIEAVRQTEKANRNRIAWMLGALGRAVSFKVRTRDTKRGTKGSTRTIRGNLLVKEASFAERILGKRFQETGKFGVKGATMEERVRNYINAATRSAGFIASGWIGARNALWSSVKQKPSGLKSKYDAKQVGRPKGKATPAMFSLRSKIVATIENTALMKSMGRAPAPGGDPMPVAVKGLQAALNFAAKDMMTELARRLQPDFKKVSAR